MQKNVKEAILIRVISGVIIGLIIMGIGLLFGRWYNPLDKL